MQNPKFSTVLGLLIEASKRNELVPAKSRSSLGSQSDIISRLSDSLKSVFKEIF